MLRKILIIFIITMIGISTAFCGSGEDENQEKNSTQSEESNQNDGTDKDSNNPKEQEIENDNTEETPDFNQMDFYEGAEAIYTVYKKYFNSFAKDTAPSGIELVTKTIDLTSFLNEQGRANKEVINTPTYKSLYELLEIIEQIHERNKKALEQSARISPRQYIIYYHEILPDLNEQLEQIKEKIDERK
jgi:hypothetical protein